MMATEQKKALYYINDLYTFDKVPEGLPDDDEPNIFGGHAHSGGKREAKLKAFANGDTSVIVFFAREYGKPIRIEDPDLVRWPTGYKPEPETEEKI
jgi:hypothetical protein